ncbi:response regulator transcription factor [uncultured Alsobacter sp.]|uniref:response regulator transcription factor n=1 Tax=uncultured Alsobacter sp. TaxID=1748258 RepID=UPI0025FBC0FF|nr:response regulator transcription factor [uncultured Alsobacter sp.]
MGNGTRAIVVEADPIYREGLIRVMTAAGFHAAQAFDGLDPFMTGVEPSSDNLLLLMGLGHAAAGVGPDVESLRRRFPGAKLVILAETGSERDLVDALQAGVDGLLVKPIGCDALVKSLELVMLGEKIFPAHFIRLLACEPAPVPVKTADHHRVFEKLSAREMDVLQELSQGSPNKIIARRFGITEATVKVHVKAILRKISARNRTEAAIWACNYLAQVDPGKLQSKAVPQLAFAGSH